MNFIIKEIREFMFHIRRYTRRYVGIVGLMGVNDYHFYWDKKKEEFFVVGLNSGGICDIFPLESAEKYLIKWVSKIDVQNTLNIPLAKKLKKYALHKIPKNSKENKKRIKIRQRI